MLTLKLGKRKWNCPRSISPSARYGARLPSSRSGPYCESNVPSASRRYASGETSMSRQRRVRDRAVIALEEVLGRDLPVRGKRVPAVAPVLERLDVDSGRGDEVGQVAERLGERCRARVGVDEEQRSPAVGAERDEAEAVAVEAVLALGPRRAVQRAVEPVRPRVVRTADRVAVSLLLDEDRAAVAADVRECTELPVVVQDDDRGQVPTSAGNHEPGPGRRPAWPTYCHVRRKISSCSRRDLGVRVGAPRQDRVHAARVPASADGRGDGERVLARHGRFQPVRDVTALPDEDVAREVGRLAERRSRAVVGEEDVRSAPSQIPTASPTRT